MQFTVQQILLPISVLLFLILIFKQDVDIKKCNPQIIIENSESTLAKSIHLEQKEFLEGPIEIGDTRRKKALKIRIWKDQVLNN